MSECCENQSFDGVSPAYKRALIAVIIINGIMFGVEFAAGYLSGSQALKADALDFAADSATYAISLAVIGSALIVRARAALLKGLSLSAMAIFVLISTAISLLDATPPEASTMGWVGFLALAANLFSVVILLRWRDGDSNVRSVWLCSRNDAIGNIGVIIAGGLVAVTQSAIPDLIVAAILAGLFFRSSYSIIGQALEESGGWRNAVGLSPMGESK